MDNFRLIEALHRIYCGEADTPNKVLYWVHAEKMTAAMVAQMEKKDNLGVLVFRTGMDTF